jgi:hypothetical protein
MGEEACGRRRTAQVTPTCTGAGGQAARRLLTAVRSRADSHRTAAAVDLALLDGLLGSSDPGDALVARAALEAQQRALQALAQDLQAALVDATVERDAALAAQSEVRGRRAGRPHRRPGRGRPPFRA